RGMMIALPAPQWERFRALSAVELAASLREMARAIDLARYRKATRGPKKPVARKVYKNGGHVSTHKLLQGGGQIQLGSPAPNGLYKAPPRGPLGAESQHAQLWTRQRGSASCPLAGACPAPEPHSHCRTRSK